LQSSTHRLLPHPDSLRFYRANWQSVMGRQPLRWIRESSFSYLHSPLFPPLENIWINELSFRLAHIQRFYALLSSHQARRGSPRLLRPWPTGPLRSIIYPSQVFLSPNSSPSSSPPFLDFSLFSSGDGASFLLFFCLDACCYYDGVLITCINKLSLFTFDLSDQTFTPLSLLSATYFRLTSYNTSQIPEPL
jgi:hypothetical protein